MLNRGLRWRVGNGEMITVASDSWIPKPHSFKSVMRNEVSNLKVCDLITPDRQGWKTKLLETMVDPEDLELIQTIPISRSGCPDKRIWHYTKKGLYSVRSGYYVVKEMMHNGEFGLKGRECQAQVD